MAGPFCSHLPMSVCVAYNRSGLCLAIRNSGRAAGPSTESQGKVPQVQDAIRQSLLDSGLGRHTAGPARLEAGPA